MLSYSVLMRGLGYISTAPDFPLLSQCSLFFSPFSFSLSPPPATLLTRTKVSWVINLQAVDGTLNIVPPNNYVSPTSEDIKPHIFINVKIRP